MTYPSGTHTATIAYDESIENVYGVTNRDAAARGSGMWSTTAITASDNSITLAKSTPTTYYTASGQVITYTYTITNNGPLPINTGQNIQIQDDKIGTFTCGTISSDIAAGGTHSCTANYTVTAGDMGASGVTNTATAGVGTGSQSFASRLHSNNASVTVPNREIVAVNDDYSSSPINGTSGGATSTVFSNDTLAGASFAPSSVTPTLVNDGGLTGAVLNADGTVTVPAGTTTGNYTLTYQICDALNASNCDTATVLIAITVSPPSGTTSCTGTNLAVNGGFETPVYSAPAGSNMESPGNVPGWTTTDTAIEIWESGFNGVPSHTGNQFGEINANSSGTLTQSPGAIQPRAQLDVYWVHRGRAGTDTANLVVTDNGGGSTSSGNFSTSNTAWSNHSVAHVASATASSVSLAFTSVSTASGDPSVGNFIDTVEVCQTYVTIQKSEVARADADGSGTDTAGDTVTYGYSIANPAGNNRSLASVTITDDKIGTVNVVTPLSGDTNTNGFLDPGETWVAQAVYTLTQADLDAGGVTNTAYASGATGTGTIRSDDDQVTVTFPSLPQLTILKTANLVKAGGNTDPAAETGDTINYTYVVENTGNITFFDVEVSDVHNGSGPFSDPPHSALTDNGTPGDSPDTNGDATVWGTLAPGDVVTFSTAYVVTQNDQDTLQ